MIGKYLVFEPEISGSFVEEWIQCLKQIIYKRETGYRLIKLNVFVDVPDYEIYVKVSREIGKSINNALGKICPAFNITAHPPGRPWKVIVEAGYTDDESLEITSYKWNTLTYVVCTSDSVKELWVGGLGLGLFESDTKSAAEAAFNQMQAILEKEGMSFNHIVRQWNYIGNILEIKNGFQNYQIFNEVRSGFYQKYRTIHGYPAATGIGMKLGGVNIDFCAVKSDEAIIIKPITNPNQVNAYEYDQNVLKGMPCEGMSVKHPPQFERALLLTRKVNSTLFISGTASILGQDTIGIEDVEKQTIVTIDNINNLTDQKRIGRIVSDTDQDWGKYILIRVYVKSQEDFSKVQSICAVKFPEVQMTLIESDICRDNLLVEIEAEFLITN
jgi:enamine deaminase RidA (YjgF/YER057c/UK114 family)